MKTIKLDLDGSIDLSRIATVVNILNLKAKHASVFRTANGWHVYISVNNTLSDADLVAVQAILGSDYKRECFNYLRVKSNNFKDGSWNMLFSKKYIIKKRRLKKTSEEKYSRRLTKSLRRKICSADAEAE